MSEQKATSPWKVEGATQAERTILYNLYAQRESTDHRGAIIDIDKAIIRLERNIRSRTQGGEG